MTTVAFDGRVLASDRQATYGKTTFEVGKLHRVEFRGEPAYIAGAGNIEDCHPVLEWVKSGMPDDAKPDIEDKAEFSFLLVTKSRMAYMADESLFFHLIGKGKQWAIGTGADYAMGAMAAGADATRAVEIASGLDLMTGLGIDTVQPGRL